MNLPEAEEILAWLIIAVVVYAGTAMFLLSGKLIHLLVRGLL
jgi:hypothetical protein